MAELTPQERLQPSLLDRLRDDEPEKNVEARDKRVLNLRQLRASVLRDLGWLFNTADLGALLDSEAYPEVATSVINFGIPDLTGNTASSVNEGKLQRAIRDVIRIYEPRILSNTVRVTLTMDGEAMNPNALVFQIEGELWAQPVPLQMFLKTELDLETGNVNVIETAG